MTCRIAANHRIAPEDLPAPRLFQNPLAIGITRWAPMMAACLLVTLDVAAEGLDSLLPEDAQHIVVAIHRSTDPVASPNQTIAGTGFLFGTSDWIYIVTAKHVLFDGAGNLLPMVRCAWHPLGDSPETPEIQDIDLREQLRSGTLLFSHLDIAAMRLGRFGRDGWESAPGAYPRPSGLQRGKAKNRRLVASAADVSTNFEEIRPTSDVIFFGYPVAINHHLAREIYDPSMPLFRKGIVAGKDISRRHLILDGFVHPGNSGGPVFLLSSDSVNSRTVRLIGLVTEYVPFISVSRDERGLPTNFNIQNAGYTIAEPIDSLLELISREH